MARTIGAVARRTSEGRHEGTVVEVMVMGSLLFSMCFYYLRILSGKLEIKILHKIQHIRYKVYDMQQNKYQILTGA